MLALCIEDKMKFRKQDVSSPNSAVQLILKNKKMKNKKILTFLLFRCKSFHETRSADSENRLDVFSLSLHENYDNDFMIKTIRYTSDIILSRALF